MSVLVEMTRPDPFFTQVVFEAAWELLTRGHQGERVSATQYLQGFGPEILARPDVLLYLNKAEERARREAAGSRIFDIEFEQNSGALSQSGEDASTEPDPYPYFSKKGGADEGLGRFGKYRVVREHGQGATGIVFEVILERPPLGPTIGPDRRALKILPPEKASVEARKRFGLEARHQHKIKNANVVEIFAAGTEPIAGAGLLTRRFTTLYRNRRKVLKNREQQA